MGNTQDAPQAPETRKKFVIELRDRDVVLDYKTKTKLTIGDLNFFPAGYEGLHLWDANIILARYVFLNKQIFEKKRVIELLSGTGIASIAAKKFTQASTIAATDSMPEVTGNILSNCKKNGLQSGMIIASISWKEYASFKNTFDFVLGAEILNKTCPTDLLLKCLRKLLSIGGYALLVVPARSMEYASQFIATLDEREFACSKTALVDEIYTESPLLNQVQGFEEFKMIAEEEFWLCTI